MVADAVAQDERERRFREMVEALPQLLWTCGPDGLCDYLSPQWVGYRGKSEAEQLGDGWLRQVHPVDRARVAAQWRASLVAGVTKSAASAQTMTKFGRMKAQPPAQAPQKPARR